MKSEEVGARILFEGESTTNVVKVTSHVNQDILECTLVHLDMSHRNFLNFLDSCHRKDENNS
jgi:hypothetical protein